ncbi:glutamyl-tRNA reductase [Echinicola sediminis]
MAQFRLLSLSHQHTDITLREKFALNQTETTELIAKCKGLPPISEILVLSTCNRTEILYTAEKDQSVSIFDLLCQLKGQKKQLAKDHFINYSNEEQVMAYLFKVSAGLQSQILGDAQIISQLKAAYALAQEQDTAGTYIHRLMHALFAANKKISSQTAFRSGISSAPYAAVDMIEEYSSMLKSPKIAVLGFGEMGQNVCRHLISKGFEELTVVNRTEDKVTLFNTKNKTQLIYSSLAHLASVVEDHDIIISTPSVPEPIITAEHFGSFNQAFKVLVDISVPRSVDPAVKNLSGLMLFDMDDISKVTEETLARKQASKAHVEKILDAYLQEFMSWKQENKNLEIIRSMKSALETIKAEELDRFQKEVPAERNEQYELIMNAMIQKIIKKTVLTMKSITDSEKRHLYNSMITQTFL